MDNTQWGFHAYPVVWKLNATITGMRGEQRKRRQGMRHPSDTESQKVSRPC
jgi:hypothetical protein